MAGPLGVSHLLLFSRSAAGNTNMRLALTPQGPTLHFRIEKYSLCKDVREAMKHPKGGRKEYMTAPLLVMNNFTTPLQSTDSSVPTVSKHLETLVTIVFQSLFPPISPQKTPLSSIRRVLLLNRENLSPSSADDPTESGQYIINLRHYIISTRRTELSRGLRRIDAAEALNSKRRNGRSLPNLGGIKDAGDYLLDPSASRNGYTSLSESEIETDAEVEVLETSARKVLDRKKTKNLRADSIRGSSQLNSKAEKRAVKLIEIGPRMRLRMKKVEEGLCDGKVMWHEYLTKSKEELEEMDIAWEKRKTTKEERKRTQRENIERKRMSRDTTAIREHDEHKIAEEDEWDTDTFEDSMAV